MLLLLSSWRCGLRIFFVSVRAVNGDSSEVGYVGMLETLTILTCLIFCKNWWNLLEGMFFQSK